MAAPRALTGWVQRTASPTGVVVIMSEPLNASLLWRLLKGWSDVPERGRTLFAPPTTNQNRLLAEFRAFVHQAETYYEAAQQSRGVSAALPLYYFALNLAKAELLIHPPARIVTGARIGHGLSTRFGRTSNARADRLSVSDGVFTVLYRHRVGVGLGRQLMSIQRVLRNVPEIGFEMQEVGDRSDAAQQLRDLVTSGHSAHHRNHVQLGQLAGTVSTLRRGNGTWKCGAIVRSFRQMGTCSAALQVL